MAKKFLVIMLVLLIAFGFGIVGVAFGQSGDDEKSSEKPKFGFNMNLNIGLSSYEDSSGQQIAFQKFSFFPEFSYGKLGVGLDLTFEFDGDFKLRDLDNDGKADTWTKFTDYLYKIYYVRYGHKGDPLYVRAGAIETYTLGHGLIMEGYNNILFYPQIHQLGLNVDLDGSLFNFPLIGFESIVDDVLDWDIIGLRVYSRPLMSLDVPIINQLKVGASFVTDLDPLEVNDPTNPDYEKYRSPKDNPDSKDNRVKEFGIDTEVPLLQKGKLSIISYADYAKIGGKGSGGLIGSTLTYDWFRFIAQLRFFGKQFVMSYFDPYYELDRNNPDEGPKYNSLDKITDSYMGYLLGTGFSILNLLQFQFSWSDGFNDAEGPRIQSGLSTVEGAIPKIDASFAFDKKDIDNFKDLFSGADTIMQLTVGYKVSGMAKIVFIFKRTYTPSGKSTDQTFIETQFSF